MIIFKFYYRFQQQSKSLNISKNMNKLKAIMKLFQPTYPQFRYLNIQDLPLSLINQYRNPIFLTPRYQKISYTQDMLKYIRFLQRSNRCDYSTLYQFVQHLLTQYKTLMVEDRPNINIKMPKNFYIPTNTACAFHGTVDWLYSADQYNMTPVMFFQRQLNPACGIVMALSNMHMRRHLKKQMQSKYKTDYKKYQHVNTYESNNIYGYSIVTTGNQWQLFRIDTNYLLQKSVILQGNNKYRSIVHDQQLISVLLGMFDYTLDLPPINVRVLQKSYQYLQERRWMIEGDQDQAKKAPLLSKLLLAYYKKKL